VTVTRVSWLCNEGVFRGKIQGASRDRAIAATRRMGYELHVSQLVVSPGASDKDWSVSLVVTNTGVAPFYYDWPVELAVADPQSQILKTWQPGWRLSTIQPGEPATLWKFEAEVPALSSGGHQLLLRVPNLLSNGPSVRFANREQDQTLPGWLTLGELPP
jgi:hypothetical protein